MLIFESQTLRSCMRLGKRRAPWHSLAAASALLMVTGCTSLPAGQDDRDTRALIESRADLPPAHLASDARAAAPEDLPKDLIDAARAVELAFRYSPRVDQAYARVGLSRADLEAARRIANPTFVYSRLKSTSGGAQVGRGITESLTDMLLLPTRTRFAAGALAQAQQRAASELISLASDVEVAWYDAASAQQIAATRAVAATAAEQSAVLAQRFFDAGNINRLALAQEKAALSAATITALRANTHAQRRRAELGVLMGVQDDASWTTATLPPANAASAATSSAASAATSSAASAATPDDLVALALSQRLDLAAARQEVAMREDALAVTRRWRWLGRVEFGYEHEHEAGGGSIQGPTLAIELPIFNQGQDAIARAQATLQEARAMLANLTLQVQNGVRADAHSVQQAREVAERYRSELVPQREAIVARTQEEVNFMLKGVFELIAAKQAEYDAYQGYLEALRDFGIERARLRAAVGGKLPDEPAPANATPPAAPPARATNAPVHDHGATQ